MNSVNVRGGINHSSICRYDILILPKMGFSSRSHNASLKVVVVGTSGLSGVFSYPN